MSKKIRKRVGRPPIPREKVRMIIKYRDEGKSYRQIGKLVGTSHETARRYCIAEDAE